MDNIILAEVILIIGMLLAFALGAHTRQPFELKRRADTIKKTQEAIVEAQKELAQEESPQKNDPYMEEMLKMWEYNERQALGDKHE